MKVAGPACKPVRPYHRGKQPCERNLTTMTVEAYLNALARLHLAPTSKVTAAALGLTVRHLANLKAGVHPVPAPVALLLRMYLKHGIPPDLLR